MTTLNELVDDKVTRALTIDIIYDINCYVIVDFIKVFRRE